VNRTLKQNSSLHKWCELLAEFLDSSGQDMRELITIPIRPNKDNVKTEIIHPVMKAINPDVTSTADLSTKEIMEIYETLVRAFADKKGWTVPAWPSEQSMSESQR
jgi:hypothetical protein